MKKKIHPADAANFAAISQAISFTVAIFHGGDYHKYEQAATLTEARIKGEEMRLALQSHRGFIVYAVLADGRAFPVPSSFSSV